jgi:uncharacterized membrane protein
MATATLPETAPHIPGRPPTAGVRSPADALPGRIRSVDIMRGIVMVLMAIDHVRVYSGQPAGGPTAGIFFTRWVTHFVAPGFLFLAGTAAFLHGRKLGDTRALSRFLLTRGLWLVFLELTFLRLAWTFNTDFANYNLAGVIWMIGWCMVIMSALVYLPLRWIGAIGIAIIVGHNLADLFQPALGQWAQGSPVAWLLKISYFGGQVSLGPGGPPLFILFVIKPWLGTMAAGYAFGSVLTRPFAEWRTFSMRLGAAMIVGFLLLRALDGYGDPRHWHTGQVPALFRFLGTSKYPASLLFLLMTLGPMLLLLPSLEKLRGRFGDALETFGRVPFFYYMLHIPLIHLSAILISRIREGRVNPWLFTNHPLAPGPLPDGYQWSLGLLYLDWVVVVVLLYFACRWYANVKKGSTNRLFSYL